MATRPTIPSPPSELIWPVTVSMILGSPKNGIAAPPMRICRTIPRAKRLITVSASAAAQFLTVFKISLYYFSLCSNNYRNYV